LGLGLLFGERFFLAPLGSLLQGGLALLFELLRCLLLLVLLYSCLLRSILSC
jgi:hypothetical protein